MTAKKDSPAPRTDQQVSRDRAERDKASARHPQEVGGPKGPEPTRYGDWEKNGIVSDF